MESIFNPCAFYAPMHIFGRGDTTKYVFIDGKQADPLENRSMGEVARRGCVKNFVRPPRNYGKQKNRIKSDGGIITINKDFSPLFGNLN